MPFHSRTLIVFTLTVLCGLCAGLLAAWAAPPSGPEAVPVLSSAVVSAQDPAPSPSAASTPVNLFALPQTASPAASSPSAAPSPADGFTLEVVSAVKPKQKRVLIYHTHTYEAYEKQVGDDYVETQQWRAADEQWNVVRVGAELTGLLQGMGFWVTHDTTAFEPPELNGAYGRSLKMLENRLSAGERYDLYIDLHRDAYSSTQTGQNTVSVGTTQLAKLMLLVGRGDGQTGEGFDQKPDWESNLQIAQAITDSLNRQVDGLGKKVMIKSGRYNQHVAVGCLLIEVGNNQNTLAQALSAMPYLADAIDQALAQSDLPGDPSESVSLSATPGAPDTAD